ncbi:MAG: nucleoside-diphosphate sugar epimerase/dehydratase [Schleiferiaceae bacterium]
MLNKIVKLYADRFLSRWIVFSFDVMAVILAFAFATLLRHNFDHNNIDPWAMQSQGIVVTLVYAFFFLGTKSYIGIIRHTSYKDAGLIFQATVLSFGFLMVASVVIPIFKIDTSFALSRSILTIHFVLSVFALLGSRFFVKAIYHYGMSKSADSRTHVIIFGAGASGILTKNALQQNGPIRYDIQAFIDDNQSKQGKTIEGIPVLSLGQVINEKFINQNNISELVISVQGLSANRKKEIVDAGLDFNLHIKEVPAMEKWIGGELSAKQIREVKIEDLLGRPPINLSNQNIANELNGKVVLVTGGAGSIGSEIVRQVLQYNPKKVIILDQAETPLYDLEFEINKGKLAPFAHLAEIVVGNVKDYLRMELVFKRFQPDIVYHAAAYKHVPLMENNPYEALMVNIFGTKIMADLSVEYGVSKFVMVSTDKAVNPTNVMGATKRSAELYIQGQSQREDHGTHFVTTRFGNVLGSNGSVIPLFRKQISQGGPLTVTHKEITRYFMTIPEACNLVLEAGAMGNGGEIFVFDMGSPVRIYDLAVKMVKLSGLELGRDINIEVTGLRPGEKLYEELLNVAENTVATHHPKIKRARIRPVNEEGLNRRLDELSELIFRQDNFSIVGKIKEMVPEFVSNNSIFSDLDNKGGL